MSAFTTATAKSQHRLVNFTLCLLFNFTSHGEIFGKAGIEEAAVAASEAR